MRIIRAILLSLLALLMVVSIALAAWEFKFPTTIEDASGGARTYYPVLMGFTGQQFVDNGKIDATGLDTNMRVGSNDIKYMMSTTNVAAVMPALPAGGFTTADFYTGWTPNQTGFPLVVGEDGYIYTSDAAGLEPGANDFEIEVDGWVDPDLTSGGRIVYKEGATGIITMPSGGISGMTLFEDPQDISPSVFAAWTTVDLHEYIPSEASGVVLRIETGAAARTVGVRHGDSTDNRKGEVDEMCWTMVGVNASQEIDIWMDSGTQIWLVGFTASNFVFNTNADDISLGGAAAWTDIDVSALAPDAVGVIVEMFNTAAVNDSWGLRKNGSTDNRTDLSTFNGIAWGIIGCDSNQVVEGYVGALTTDFYLLGYVTDGATFATNATDKSIGVAGWTDIDCSAEAPGADYLIFEVVGGGISGNTYGFRKNGSAENIVEAVNAHMWVIVECDENQIVEGTSSNVAVGFFLVGYITKGVFEPADCLVTDTGFTEADQTVTLTKDDLIYAPGYAMHFPDAANGEVDCGNIGNGAKFWISVWFKLDVQWPSAWKDYIWGKWQGANDNLGLYLHSDNMLHFEHQIGGVVQFDISVASPSGSGNWEADTWYHAFASLGQAAGGGAASDGARLRVNNGVAATDANVAALNNTGNFVIGDRKAGDAQGIDSYIANVVWGNDDVTAAEELALYQNVLPGDEQGAWYIDEGRGTDIIDYGAGGNDGTAGAACTWSSHEDRPCKLVLSVDGTKERGYARPVTVTDNGRRWEWMDETSVPYANYITYDISGAEVMRYQPTTMLTAETVNDETGAFDGTIVWGENTQVVLHAGEMESSDATASEAGSTGGWTMPTSLIPATWFATGENLTDLPLYDAINSAATDAGIPTQTVYFWIVLGIAIGAFMMVTMFAKSALGGLIAMLIVLFAGSSMTIIPMWIPFIVLLVCIGVMFLYRQVTY